MNGAKDCTAPCAYVLGSEDNPAFAPEIPGIRVLAVNQGNWFRDFSPWPAPPAQPGGTAFAGGGEAHLARLVGECIPRLEEEQGLRPRLRMLAGYSLAGLFALYAATRQPGFAGVASVSGSLWYPGWLEFLEGLTLPPGLRWAYLSLGDREEKAGSPVLRQVGEGTRRTAALLQARGVETALEWNPGGHFREPEARMERALLALARFAQKERESSL